MRGLTCITILLCFNYLQAQSITVDKDITYTTARSWDNKQQDLMLDVYYPRSDKKIPLVVYLHGGGFQNGDKNDDDASVNSMLAQNGFVAVTVNYRLGFDAADQQGIVKAFYRGAQDLDAALRYLVHHADKYNIDTTAVFIGGSSAGGVLALANAYESQREWDAVFPMLHQDLGALAGKANNFQASYTIRGVYNLWGGIADTALISAPESKAIPVLLVQSQADEVIPYEHAKGESTEFKVLYGSYDIAERFKTNGGCCNLYFVKGAGHGRGFSQAYVVKALSLFINDVLSGNCRSARIENKGADSSKFFGVYKE